MEITEATRLFLVYAHLLLCAFALQQVLSGDVRVLRNLVTEQELRQLHQRVIWLLAGLWLTGAALIGVDMAFGPAFPSSKLIAKVVTVSLLTLNGFALGRYCLPRVARMAKLGRTERRWVMACGAMSTAGWLMAAFFGIARPLQSWHVASLLGLYAAVVAAAVLVSQWLAARHEQRRTRRSSAGLAPMTSRAGSVIADFGAFETEVPAR